MKVLLVEPGTAMPDYIVLWSAFRMPPLPSLYLAGPLEEAGHQVQILTVAQHFGLPTDDQSYQARHEDIKAYLSHQSYDVLGISITSGEAYVVGLDIAEASKAVHKGARIVVGGYHASATWQDILDECPAVDVVVIGEGDVTIVELVKAFETGAPLATVKGIAFRQDGKATRTEPRPLVANLDDLPLPAFHALDYLPRYSRLPILTSRGCPFHCDYCSEQMMTHGVWRGYSAERVIETINLGLKYIPTDDVIFLDPLFGFRPKQRRELFERLSQGSLSKKIQWGAEIRADLFDLDDLTWAAKAGARFFFVGVEAGSPEMLQIMRKTANPEKYLQAVFKQAYAFRDVGISGQYFFVIGHPGETQKTILETVRVARDLVDIAPDKTDVVFHIYVPYPGTASYNDMPRFAQLYGTRLLDAQWWKKRVRGSAFFQGFYVSPSAEISNTDLKAIRVEAFRAIGKEMVLQQLLQFAASIPKGRVFTYMDWARMFQPEPR